MPSYLAGSSAAARAASAAFSKSPGRSRSMSPRRNRIWNAPNVFTYKDTAIVTPNSDTPYSFVAMDLRAEPFVICNPDIEASRYFSVQLIDMYTFNFGYMGSRTTGNHAACNMVTGPG